MRCRSCPALRTSGYEYPEEYCGLGIDDADTIEFQDGDSGCKRRSVDKIISDLKIEDEIESQAFADEAKSFVEFMNNEKE